MCFRPTPAASSLHQARMVHGKPPTCDLSLKGGTQLQAAYGLRTRWGLVRPVSR